jgi:hypothetical protein
MNIVDANGVAKGMLDSGMLEAREREQAERRTKMLLSRMSPRGQLGLPPLLESRRWEYGITDGAFDRQAVFDRVFIRQIAMQKGNTYEPESKIVMPDSVKMKEKNKAPHGIVVSAGLTALDQLRSHGIDLGHKVLFAHTAPYHIRYDILDGEEQHLIILLAGDIIGSEDLASNLKSRAVRYLARTTETGVAHTFIDDNGKPWLPADAWRAEHE